MNRRSACHRRGIALSLSKLADQVGAYAAVLKPVHALIKAHVLAARRLHDDCATVPILASGELLAAGNRVVAAHLGREKDGGYNPSDGASHTPHRVVGSHIVNVKSRACLSTNLCLELNKNV